MKKEIAICFALLCICFSVWAQTKVSGKVINMISSEKVSSVSILVKGHSSGTFSDENGKFKLEVNSLPATLLISSIGFETQEVTINNSNEPVTIQLKPFITMGEVVVVAATRMATKLLESPVSIERIGLNEIRNSPATSYYDLASYKKGIDVTTSSLTFKTISTRGFNGSGSTRVNQIVDGMDNQAPGLNFFVGNFLGLTELDVENMELLPGASSALYGPGGMNGTILINSKNPFEYQGLSVLLKEGVNHVDKKQRPEPSAFHDFSFRWAKVFHNKFAFKIGGQYISAKDWLANDSTDYLRLGNTGNLTAGTRQTDPNYDGVNVYGDETSVDIRPFMLGAIQQNANLQPVLSPFLGSPYKVSRTGYAEKDLIDPKTKNIKLSGALHYKFTDKLEGQLMGYWATGNTIYTDESRYVLKNIMLGQYKAELKHTNWFVRAYTTQEDAGDAYSGTATGQLFNEGWKRSFDPANIAGSWYPQYLGAFATAAGTVFQQVYMNALNSGQSSQQAMAAAQAAVVGASSQFHQIARAFADRDRPQAGSQQFNQLFDQVTKVPIPNGGRFKENSQLWMAEGQYNLSSIIKFADVLVGGNVKKYILNSDGTLFIDTLNAIKINEAGAYVQITKKFLNDFLTLSFSGRYDKNEDFKEQFTPRATAVVKVAKDNNLRFSYQTAYRFPSTLAKYIHLNLGEYALLGGLPWVVEYMDVKSRPVFELTNNVPATMPYVYKEFKAESVRSFEVGYKGLIANKLLIDAYGYLGRYQNFLGRNFLLQPSTGTIFSTVINSPNKIKTYGYGIGLDYRLPKDFSVFFNLYSDELTNIPSGFKAYYNTPKYRVNAGFANSGLGRNKLLGFSALYHWQDAYDWEGELANGPVHAYSAIDAQISYKLPKIHSVVKLGGTNILNHYYKSAYGFPEVGSLYYLSLGYNIF
jgi:outer membrane receptor protein involved in Fe transport